MPETNRSYNAVILDMDGVITQTAKVHAKAWKTLFDEYLSYRKEMNYDIYSPFEIEEDYPKHLDGIPRYDGVRKFLQSREIDIPFGDKGDRPGYVTICSLGNRKNEIFLDLIEQQGVSTYKDAIQKLKEWKVSGVKRAVISSSRNCRQILEAAGIVEIFNVRVDGVVSEELNLSGKPSPDIFLKAAELLHEEPGSCLVFEDAEMGIEAAKKGNFAKVIGVARNNNSEKLSQAGADHIIHSFDDLSSKGKQTSNPADLPNALDHIDEIKKRIPVKLTLFLDYDGTMVPIAKTPDEAVISDKMHKLLSQLSQSYNLAIISGRDLEDVKEKANIKSIWYAGSHGLDILGPEGEEKIAESARDYLPDLDEAEKLIRQNLGDFNQIKIERKKFAIAIHYRNTSEADAEEIKSFIQKEFKDHQRLKFTKGKQIREIRPSINWHKGKAIKWLMKNMKESTTHLFPIYIGDDITDEDAFEEVLNLNGLPIICNPHEENTYGAYALKDPDEVYRFLQQLVENNDFNG